LACIDTFFAIIAFSAALLLTSKFNFDRLDLLFTRALPLLICLRIGAFFYFQTYALIIRFIGEKDYYNVMWAVGTSSVAFYLVMWLYPQPFGPKELLPIVMIDYFVLLILMAGFRSVLRLLFDQLRSQRTSHLNTVIFGAGEMGVIMERVLSHSNSHNFRVMAFFDDNPKVKHKFLNGKKVFDPAESFEYVVEKYDISHAIIAINNLPDERRIQFINRCLPHNIKVLKVPSPENWINNRLNVGQLTTINFEDLLSRPPILLSEDRIREGVEDKVILVTGCAGSIGSEILRQVLRFQPRLLVGVDQAETPLVDITLEKKEEVAAGILHTIIADVRDADKMRQIFTRYRPDYVFHAAAYKHVPIMERFPEEAIKSNVMGTKNVADLAGEFGAHKFVMISTDKVVNSTNVMGASKGIAELYVRSLNGSGAQRTQYITTRFGNVLGSNGSVVPIFKRQIQARQPVTVTHPEVTRYFMTIPEACQLVLEAGAMGQGGEIFVFDMGEPVRIVDLAEKMIQLAGLTRGVDIDIVFTGLRPGEKLTEELFSVEEQLAPTHHEKIRKATVQPYSAATLHRQIAYLIDLARQGDAPREVVAQMKEILPSFRSQNSVFSEPTEAATSKAE
jgi:FlaA1/EpsC-like NDP-sugar epimerase